MNTPTHILVSAVLLAKPNGDEGADHTWRNIAAIAGSLFPDLSLYIMWGGAKFIFGIPDRVIFGQMHFSPFWQTLNAISNSVPVFFAILLFGIVRKSVVATVFGISALLHMALDFPFHNSDAHRHFWPFSDWKFHSPISYWNTRFHGEIVGYVEIAVVLVLIAILWVRFKDWWVRALLVLSLVPYIAVPLYFSAL